MPNLHRMLIGIGLLTCLAAQVLPYYLPVTLPTLDGLDPTHHARFIAAEAFNAPIRWAAIGRELAIFPLVIGLMLAGWGKRWELDDAAGPRRWSHLLIFLLILYAALFAVTLPGRYLQFRHWLAFDLSHLSTPMWTLLVLKSQAIPLVKFIATNFLAYCFMSLLPRRWWLAMAAMLFLLFHAIPEVIGLTQPRDPIEQTVPMEPGPYREKLEAIAAKADRTCSFMVSDESERSGIMNAHVTGKLGREYVVFTDNWMREVPADESAAAMAHELGHLVTRHITTPVNFALGLLGSILILGLVARFHSVRPGHRLQAMLLMVLMTQTISLLSRPALAALNRYQEREADAYALRMISDGEQLEQVLIRTAKANLETWQTPRWYYLYMASYPDLAKRVAACRKGL